MKYKERVLGVDMIEGIEKRTGYTYYICKYRSLMSGLWYEGYRSYDRWEVLEYMQKVFEVIEIRESYFSY